MPSPKRTPGRTASSRITWLPLSAGVQAVHGVISRLMKRSGIQTVLTEPTERISAEQARFGLKRQGYNYVF
jgi:hypothetical protein